MQLVRGDQPLEPRIRTFGVSVICLAPAGASGVPTGSWCSLATGSDTVTLQRKITQVRAACETPTERMMWRCPNPKISCPARSSPDPPTRWPQTSSATFWSRATAAMPCPCASPRSRPTRAGKTRPPTAGAVGRPECLDVRPSRPSVRLLDLRDAPRGESCVWRRGRVARGAGPAGKVIAGQVVAVERRPAAHLQRELARGPGRLADALGITRALWRGHLRPGVAGPCHTRPPCRAGPHPEWPPKRGLPCSRRPLALLDGRGPDGQPLPAAHAAASKGGGTGEAGRAGDMRARMVD